MKTTIIGRHGHMEPQKRGAARYIDDMITVRVDDDDDSAVGQGPSEAEAEQAAKDALERFRVEQQILEHPDVAAARQAMADAIRKVKEAGG